MVIVGQRVMVGEGVNGVPVGERVMVGVGVIVGGEVGFGVKLGVDVGVGRGVLVGLGPGVGVNVIVGVGEGVMVGDKVIVGDVVGSGVGGSPTTVKLPVWNNCRYKYMYTVYSPGSQFSGVGFQSVYPIPPVPPSQGKDSEWTNSPSRNHKAVH